eukprot:196930_1
MAHQTPCRCSHAPPWCPSIGSHPTPCHSSHATACHHSHPTSCRWSHQLHSHHCVNSNSRNRPTQYTRSWYRTNRNGRSYTRSHTPSRSRSRSYDRQKRYKRHRHKRTYRNRNGRSYTRSHTPSRSRSRSRAYHSYDRSKNRSNRTHRPSLTPSRSRSKNRSSRRQKSKQSNRSNRSYTRSPSLTPSRSRHRRARSNSRHRRSRSNSRHHRANRSRSRSRSKNARKASNSNSGSHYRRRKRPSNNEPKLGAIRPPIIDLTQKIKTETEVIPVISGSVVQSPVISDPVVPSPVNISPDISNTNPYLYYIPTNCNTSIQGLRTVNISPDLRTNCNPYLRVVIPNKNEWNLLSISELTQLIRHPIRCCESTATPELYWISNQHILNCLDSMFSREYELILSMDGDVCTIATTHGIVVSSQVEEANLDIFSQSTTFEEYLKKIQKSKIFKRRKSKKNLKKSASKKSRSKSKNKTSKSNKKPSKSASTTTTDSTHNVQTVWSGRLRQRIGSKHKTIQNLDIDSKQKTSDIPLPALQFDDQDSLSCNSFTGPTDHDITSVSIQDINAMGRDDCQNMIKKYDIENCKKSNGRFKSYITLRKAIIKYKGDQKPTASPPKPPAPPTATATNPQTSTQPLEIDVPQVLAAKKEDIEANTESLNGKNGDNVNQPILYNQTPCVTCGRAETQHSCQRCGNAVCMICLGFVHDERSQICPGCRSLKPNGDNVNKPSDGDNVNKSSEELKGSLKPSVGDNANKQSDELTGKDVDIPKNPLKSQMNVLNNAKKSNGIDVDGEKQSNQDNKAIAQIKDGHTNKENKGIAQIKAGQTNQDNKDIAQIKDGHTNKDNKDIAQIKDGQTTKENKDIAQITDGQQIDSDGSDLVIQQGISINVTIKQKQYKLPRKDLLRILGMEPEIENKSIENMTIAEDTWDNLDKEQQDALIVLLNQSNSL